MMHHQYHHSQGIPLSPHKKFGHCQSLYDSRVVDHSANPERFHFRHPIGETLYNPHLSEIRTFMVSVRTIMIIHWLKCSVCFALFCRDVDCNYFLLVLCIACVCTYACVDGSIVSFLSACGLYVL